jgi:pimeloyl-[acyl-carrier protein] methyl ester esterase
MELNLRKRYDPTCAAFVAGMFEPGELSSGEIDLLFQQAVPSFPRQDVALAALRQLATSDLRGVLPRVTVPTLLIHGDDDRVCPVGASHYMVSQIPGADLVTLPGIGHAPFLSRPAVCGELLNRFIPTCHDQS